MLSDLFHRFINPSPVTVMIRRLLGGLLNPEQRDAWFARTAEKQYTRELLFSTVVDLLVAVVCGMRKSVHVAYQGAEPALAVWVQSVYNKLNGLEPGILAALVGYAGREAAALIEELYRKRWRIETVFQEVEKYFESEINTFGYPRAALFGFCLALVAYNVLAVVQAALRHVHGQAIVDYEISGYYLAEEIGATYRGMMIAIPPPQWQCFQDLSRAQRAELLVELARHVRLSAFCKHRREAKKPRAKPKYDPKRPHVSTAKLIAERRGR